jgi:hypothetical protein
MFANTERQRSSRLLDESAAAIPRLFVVASYHELRPSCIAPTHKVGVVDDLDIP